MLRDLGLTIIVLLLPVPCQQFGTLTFFFFLYGGFSQSPTGIRQTIFPDFLLQHIPSDEPDVDGEL